MAPKTELNLGRINQKHRTRNALLQAAAQLMQQGHIPSLEEVADAALVSRATAYRYFPTQEHILAGTIILKANLDGEAKLELLMNSNDPSVRLDGVVQAFHERFSTNEVAYRALLRVLLQPTEQNADMDTNERPQKRASRQVYWLHQALAPIQSQIDHERFERLIAALVAATGFEAFIAMRDISLMDSKQIGEVMRWTAQVLLKASLTKTDTF
jgi:AcrR family transcriptional regulator